MALPPFTEFNKIPRLSREVIVTEKIDGTNAQIYTPEEPVCGACGHNDYSHARGEPCYARPGPSEAMCDCRQHEPAIYAGSRTRWITPEDDNHGFARWVEANKQELMKLGPGIHFGEWWGAGIQRGYGMKYHKRFSLFNVSRWGPGGKDEAQKPACCEVVPVLWRGNFEELMGPGGKLIGMTTNLKIITDMLLHEGSKAAPGFMRPEGIVIYHVAGNLLFKKTLEKDDQPKSKG